MRPQSFWSHYAKAAAVFTLTTATYLIARTTGWLPRWLSGEKSAENTDTETLSTLSVETVGVLPSSIAGQITVSSFTNFHAVELTVPSNSEEDSDKALTHLTQRRLLQQPSQVTIINPIPDQVIEIGQPYSYSLDNVFSGDFLILDATETEKTTLPNWLSLQYKLLGSYPAGSGRVYDVAVSSGTAFVADSTAGLLILNVSTPSAPCLLANYSSGSSGTEAVAVLGNTLYVANGYAGLLILDVSILSVPRLLGSYPTGYPGYADDVVVSGGTIFVANGMQGLLILDASMPDNPRLLGKYLSSTWAYGVAVSGNTVFMAASSSVLILDATNPSAPRLLNSYPTSSATGIVVSGNLVFVADWSLGLLILDASTPSAPKLLSNYFPGTNGVSDVAVIGNMVFLANGYAGFLALDVGVPSTPRLMGNYSANSITAQAVTVSDNLVYVGDVYAGLLILDTSQGQLTGVPPNNPGKPIGLKVRAYNSTVALEETVFILILDQFPYFPQVTITDQSIFPGKSLSLHLSSDLFVNPSYSALGLSVRTTSGGVVPVWLRLASLPIFVNSYPLSETNFAIIGVTISGTILFVSIGNTIVPAGGWLLILDMRTPSVPKLLGNYSMGAGYPSKVVISGNILFLAAYSAGLLILDVNTPGNPHLLSSYMCRAFDVSILGSTLFVAAGPAGLLILDVGTPGAPRLLSNNSIGLTETEAVAVSGSRLFVLDQFTGILILDVSIPNAPRLLGNYSGSFPGSLAVSGNILFVAARSALLILDVSTPSVTELLCTYSPGSGLVYRAIVTGNMVFVADGAAGMLVLDMSIPQRPQLLGSYPVSSGGSSEDVAVSGNTMFLANYGDLLILDLSQWMITALPTVADVGNYNLELMATDALGGTAFIPFTIRVEGPPLLNGSIPLQRAWVSQPFNYFVPSNLFVDPNDDVIDYSANLMSGKSLPLWLKFNPQTIGFGGVPESSDWGNITITLSATDHICPEIPTVNFTISVSFLPVLSRRITNQLAPIGLPYQFSVSKNSFYDPAGLALSYLAQGVNNQPLPSWLQFNATTLVFWGVANTSNTTVYTLQLIATNSAGGQVIASFTLRTDHFPVFNKILSLPTASVNQAWVWTLPSDAFTDTDGDLLTYFATQEDGGPLPSWLSFNPITKTFTGVPLFTGTQGLKITAQDSYGGGSNSTYFNITILPESQAGSLITPPSARAGKLFAFQVNASIIFGSGNTFNYSASLADGGSLPSWLQFISNNLSFTGLPESADVGSYDITLTTTDSQDTQYNVSFVLNVNPNYPPQVYLPISNQVAQVNEPFVFYASEQTFVDPNGDNLTYTVNALPSWLSFDPQQLKFWGTPSRSDTDPLTAHVNNIEFIAHDDESQTSTLFTISVQGTSNLLLSLQIGVPLLSLLASVWKAYQNRALLLNRCCRKRILKCDVTAVIGEEFQLNLITKPEEVGNIRVKLPKPEESKATRCCARLFRPCERIVEESPDHLPLAYPLPKWMGYYADHNRLFSKGRVPPMNRPQFTVQVLNSASVIREEVSVTVQAARV